MKINRIAVSVGLTLTLSFTHNYVSAQNQDLHETVKTYFLETLKTKQSMELKSKDAYCQKINFTMVTRKQLKAEDIESNRQMVWQAWREANQMFPEAKLIKAENLQYGSHDSWSLPETLEPNAIMPYYYGYKGELSGKMPFFIYLHGSGSKELEWRNGLRLGMGFNDGPSLYFIPQIPNEGDYYRWWQVAKQYAWERLFRQTLTNDNIDPNRLYVFGISEGGYGSQRLASFYADYWAAAGPMAGGEPLKNAPVENCANIGFSFLTGAQDADFYRNKLTGYTKEAFEAAKKAHPTAADGKPLFNHRITLIPGRQHAIEYGPTTPWLKECVRNPYPKTVLWEDFEMDGRRRSGFYNLQVLQAPSDKRTYYDMSINDNVIKLNINDVDYTATERDERWGIEMKFRRSYSKAKGGRLRIYLNDKLVDLNQPVTVIINDKQLYQDKVKITLQDMVNSCLEYYDPYRIYPASIELKY